MFNLKAGANIIYFCYDSLYRPWRYFNNNIFICYLCEKWIRCLKKRLSTLGAWCFYTYMCCKTPCHLKSYPNLHGWRASLSLSSKSLRVYVMHVMSWLISPRATLLPLGMLAVRVRYILSYIVHFYSHAAELELQTYTDDWSSVCLMVSSCVCVCV